MMKRFWRTVRLHVYENLIYYSVVCAAFIIGIIIGVLSFDISIEGEIKTYLSGFFSGLGQADNFSILIKSIVLNIVLVLILFLSSVSIAGCVAAPAAAAYKGFLIGYTVSAFYGVYGLKCLWTLLLGILPSAVIWIAPLFLLCVCGMKFSVFIINCCNYKTRQRDDFWMYFIRFTAISLICLAFFLLSSVVDAYITPALLGLASGIFI